MPEADIAAALAVVPRATSPLLLDPEPEPPAGLRRSASDRRGPRDGPGRDRDDRRRTRGDRVAAPRPSARWRRTGSRSASATRSSRARSSAPSPTRAASAASDFGHIDIRADHSLVELPATLPGRHAGTSCESTRISGKLIELSESQERGSRSGPAKSHRKGPRD